MTTHCRIEFYSKKFEAEEPAVTFRSSDGYPSAVIPQLRELENSLGDHRHEPRSAAVCDAGHVDYVYRVVCSKDGWQIFVYKESQEGALKNITAEALAAAEVKTK
jgi:hypothetical protein